MNLESIQKGVVEAVKFYVLHVVAPEGSSPFPDRRIVPVRLRWYDLYFSTGYEVIIEISSSKKETYGFAAVFDTTFLLSDGEPAVRHILVSNSAKSYLLWAAVLLCAGEGRVSGLSGYIT